MMEGGYLEYLNKEEWWMGSVAGTPLLQLWNCTFSAAVFLNKPMHSMRGQSVVYKYFDARLSWISSCHSLFCNGSPAVVSGCGKIACQYNFSSLSEEMPVFLAGEKRRWLETMKPAGNFTSLKNYWLCPTGFRVQIFFLFYFWIAPTVPVKWNILQAF